MNNKNLTKPIEVLLIEDDPGDVDLTKEIIDNAKIKINLNVVDNGIKALEYLYRRGKYAASVRPDLIMLDLNMPKKDGREVLQEIKSDEQLKSIPVVILTTSNLMGVVFNLIC